jgi:cell fate regulator YaaT (PSP1 superfamily)
MSEVQGSQRNTTSTEGPTVVAVRFQPAGKAYHFIIPSELELTLEDWVVVETAYGLQVGRVVELDAELPEGLSLDSLKQVLRPASGLDMGRHGLMEKRGKRMVEVAQEEIDGLRNKSRGTKAVTAEVTLDGKRAILFYTGNLSNKDRRYVQQRVSSRMNISTRLRPMGPRDEAKALGGYGICGEPRCCTRFLTEFEGVSIRMAKDQSISMAPSDITGMCGRLRCCIAYEHEVYKEASKGFPKRKSHVETPEGIGRVIDWDVLREEVVVEIPTYGPRRDRKRYHFAVDEVKVVPKNRK